MYFKLISISFIKGLHLIINYDKWQVVLINIPLQIFKKNSSSEFSLTYLTSSGLNRIFYFLMLLYMFHNIISSVYFFHTQKQELVVSIKIYIFLHIVYWVRKNFILRDDRGPVIFYIELKVLDLFL